MRVLLTGAAGFIGFHVAEALLKRGDEVIGVDSLNHYYDVKLKEARLNQLLTQKNFSFHKINVADQTAMLPLTQTGVTHIAHLAAQAGVRYSLENPGAYIEANVLGQSVMLEIARQTPGLKHFLFASSSSVYGGNTKIPFAVGDVVDQPLSPYAATKRAGELLTYTQAQLYKIPCTGLRYFTVYGPWGRPDMAPILFTKKILAGEPIQVFNHGKMKRDFTYIDDIVAGTLAALDRAPNGTDVPPYALYNLGNSHAENLTDFIAALEATIGMKAKLDLQPLQPGDPVETYADIASSARDLGFKPSVKIAEGIPKFVDWYRGFYKA